MVERVVLVELLNRIFPSIEDLKIQTDWESYNFNSAYYCKFYSGATKIIIIDYKNVYLLFILNIPSVLHYS